MSIYTILYINLYTSAGWVYILYIYTSAGGVYTVYNGKINRV